MCRSLIETLNFPAPCLEAAVQPDRTTSNIIQKDFMTEHYGKAKKGAVEANRP